MRPRAGHRRGERGVTTIEFSLLALPLLVLLMGGIEFGFVMYTKARLEGVLQEAARMASTGNDAVNGVGGINIDNMVRARLKVTQNASVVISKNYYDHFDQVHTPEDKDSAGTTPPYCWTDVNGNKKWDQDPSRSGLGGANDIVNYKVTVTYPFLFPLVADYVVGSQNMALTGQTTLQSEPFAGGTDLAPQKCCISAATGNPVTCTPM